MGSVKLAAAGCALVLGAVGCGSDESSGGAASGSSEAKALKIYSSLPLQGASRAQAEAVVDGATLALEQAGGKAGEHTVEYESLDDSTAQAGQWTPEAESANAPKASQDDATVIYLGRARRWSAS